jgi:hypothetical protein
MGAVLSQAWKEAKLAAVEELLRTGYVMITFRKVDGTVTTRKATRNAELVPDLDEPRGGAAGRAAIAFYSETDHACRSFCTDNLIRFKAAKPSNCILMPLTEPQPASWPCFTT